MNTVAKTEADFIVVGTGPEGTGDTGGGAVGEKHEHTRGGAQHRAGDPQPGQVRRAEMPHDGRIDEQEQRLGHESEERRNRQAQNLPGQAAVAGHARHRSGACAETEIQVRAGPACGTIERTPRPSTYLLRRTPGYPS